MRRLANFMGLTLAFACAGAWAADQHDDGARKPPPAVQGQLTQDADNTGMNERDKSGETQTPQDQSNDAADREVLAAVRREIVDDDALSTSAHNVKILVKDGVVTLRGPVSNAEEKGRIETLAHQVQGVASVENQLDIKTD